MGLADALDATEDQLAAIISGFDRMTELEANGQGQDSMIRGFWAVYGKMVGLVAQGLGRDALHKLMKWLDALAALEAAAAGV